MRCLCFLKRVWMQDVREFATTTECIAELRRGGWDIWATDLSEVRE